MNRRVSRPLVIVASLLLAACSDDGGGEPADDTRPPDTEAVTTTEPDSPETTAAGTTPGTGAPDAPSSGVEVGEIDASVLAGAGRETIINDLFWLQGDRVAVGHVQQLQDGNYQPLILESREGDRWQRGTAGMPRGADQAVMSSIVHVDGTVFVIGTQWTGDRANGVVWTQSEDGWEPNELVGDIAGTRSQIVRDAAGGPDGLVALGTSEGEESIWTSTDGITWSIPTIRGNPENLELIDTAANRHGILVLATADGRPTVLHSDDGSVFRVLQTGNRRQRWNVVTATADQLVVGGAVYNGRSYAPRIWRLRDAEWPDRAERPDRERSHYQWGSDAEVDAISHDGGRLLFTIDGVLISSPRRNVWVQYARPEGDALTDVTALVPVPGASTDHAEALVGGSRLYIGDEEEWTESTPGAMATPYQRVELAGIAHHDGTWVAAGTTTDGLGATSASVWYSPDAVNWRAAHTLNPDDRTYALTVSASDNGFVVTGQDPRNQRALIWTSGNGRRWSRVREPELRWPKRGGTVQPESVIAIPDGFAVGGFRQRRRGIEPWLIRVRSELQYDDGEQMHGRTDSAVAGICRPPGNIYMVGTWIGPGTSPAWWSQSGLAPWERHRIDGAGELRECIATADDVFALGTIRQREAVVDITTSQADVLPLPESDATLATDLEFVGEDNRRIVVGGHTEERAGDGRLWVGDEGDPGSWTVIDAPQLGGPGAQRIAGIAGTGNRIIVAVNDGSGAQLTGLQLHS